ncbi:MAG: CbtB domain-containing protein [Janthinobacterium lividum]
MNDHRSLAVAAPAPTAVELAPLPVRAVLPWLVLAALLALVTMYFVGAEQGATSLFNGTAVHEWTHDGRHLLGFPCH